MKSKQTNTAVELSGLLSIADAARYLGISKQSAYRRIRSGTLPAGVVIRIGRSIKIMGPTLRAWLDAGGSGL